MLPAIFCAIVAAAGGAGSWSVAAQPDLKAQLDAAPALQVEDLGSPARSVTNYPPCLVPNPDGRTWDVLQWYYKTYYGPTWLYAIDLGTGEVKKQRFPDRHQIHLAGQTLAPDGKYYIVTPVWGRGGGMDLFVYDPATNTLEERGRIVPDLVGERRDLIVGPDGRLYGTGNYVNPPKAGAYVYDPKTRQVRNYGPIGPSHAPNACWGYYLGVCDTHIYVASGKIPWYLVAVNIETGEDKVLLEAPAVGIIQIRQRFPGAVAEVRQEEGGPRKEYWLYRGQAIPKVEDKPPWPPKESPVPKPPPRPELYTGETYPDAQGNAKLWYRLPEDAARLAKIASPGVKPEDLGWKCVHLSGIETYPLPLHRLVLLPNGKIFGRAFGYLGNFLFDPATGQSEFLGDGGGETYTYLLHEGKLWWSGYPSGPVYVYDPAKPWTIGKSGPPGHAAPTETDPASNPRLLGRLFDKTRAKLMRGSAAGADGRIYFGGMGLRDYEGGSFGWVDPRTGEMGGFWRPLSGYRVYWLTAAAQGRYIVMSTRTGNDELNNNQKPPEAKIFVWDTLSQQIVREIVPVPRADRTGPLAEISGGGMQEVRLIGIADDPETKGAGIIYGVDIRSGEVLFRKTVPYALTFPVGHQSSPISDYRLGPDGWIWTFLGKTLVRIRPADAWVVPVGRVEVTGSFAFVGPDLYLSGTEQLRRIRNAVKP